jgi:phosphatidylglycerophosphatase A
VRKLEKLGGGGGLGIMADDIGAGVLACLATHASLYVLTRLGW